MDRHADFIAFCDGRPVAIFDEDNDRFYQVLILENRGASANTLARRILYNNRKGRSAGKRIVQKTKQWMVMHRWAHHYFGPQENSKLYQWRALKLSEKRFGGGELLASFIPREVLLGL